MINLLPPDTKRAYYYAQSNEKLARWVFALMIGFIGLGAIGTYGWVTLHRATATNDSKVAFAENQLTQEHQAVLVIVRLVKLAPAGMAAAILVNSFEKSTSCDRTLTTRVKSPEIV